MPLLKKQSLFKSLLSIFLISFQSSSFAEECCEYEPRELTIEAKAGYFIFANEKMRDVYDKGGYEVQLSSSYRLIDCWHLYGSVNFLEARGKSTHFKEKTTFWQIPVDIGLKPIVHIASCVDWYMAFGPRFFYAEQHNHSDYVKHHVKKGGLGLFVNSGFDLITEGNFFMNLFGEYAYQPIKASSSKHNTYRRTIQVGGFSLGAGFGYNL